MPKGTPRTSEEGLSTEDRPELESKKPEAPEETTEQGKEVEPITPEQEPEEEAVKESAETVAELIEDWKEEYETTKDSDRKRELAYRMVQLDLALGTAHLRPDQVKLRESSPGVLGFYVPDTKEIAITPEGLDLPAEHYRDVLVHEATHAGKITGHRVLDEGMAQKVTERKVPSPMHGIYEGEQRKVEKAYGEDAPDALELYDFDDPHELVTFYLETEWQDRWSGGLKDKLERELLASNERERARLFERKLAEDADKIEERFKKATPNLYEKLKRLGFDFNREQREIFDELYVRDILERKAAA